MSLNSCPFIRPCNTEVVPSDQRRKLPKTNKTASILNKEGSISISDQASNTKITFSQNVLSTYYSTCYVHFVILNYLTFSRTLVRGLGFVLLVLVFR